MKKFDKTFSRRFQLAALVCMAMVVGACQTDSGDSDSRPSLTIEEAKRVTAVFEGKGFRPPPKSITDITAILDQQKLSDTGTVGEYRAQADASLPEGSPSAKDMAKFHYRRGEAARRIGRDVEALADLRKAAKFLKRASMGRKWQRNIHHQLAFMELYTGNAKTAIRHMEKGIRARPTWSGYRGLIEAYAKAGDLKGAKNAWRRGKDRIAGFANKRNADAKDAVWNDIESARMDYELFSAQAKYKKAEKAIRHAIDVYRRDIQDDNKPAMLSSRLKQLAGTLKHQGRLMEAEVVAREALLTALSDVGRNNSTTADGVRQLSSILVEQGRYDEAEKLARAAIDIHQRIGTHAGYPRMERLRKALINVLVANENWQGALKQVETARAAMKDRPRLFKKMFMGQTAYGIALLRSGRVDEAFAFFAAAYEKAKNKLGERHTGAAKWLTLMAVAQTESGDKKTALEGFQKALPVMLSRSRQADDENSTKTADEQLLGIILESYIGLLADIQGTAIESEAGIDAAANAFSIADLARGRAVQRALAASGARASISDPELADLARREQDAQKRIAALYAMLSDVLSAPSDQQDAKAVKALRADIDSLRGARATLMGEIEKRFPDYADLINPKAGTIEAARAVLRPDEALISTFVGRDRTYVWAVPKVGKAAFAVAQLGHEDMADLVGVLRSALEPNAAELGDIPDFDMATAYMLYKAILAPVKAGWGSANNLLVVAHGPLGYLPLSLLPTAPYKLEARSETLFANHKNAPWLARTHGVTVLPSVASLKTLRGLPKASAKRKPFVGFGDPYFSVEQASLAKQQTMTSGFIMRAAPKTAGLDSAELEQLPRLPDTKAEIMSIANALKADIKTDVFIGARANEEIVKNIDLTSYRIIAFATHGLIPGDLNGLTQPALALSAPEVFGGGGDGLLTMDEILGLRLNADWVVLSACNTASGAGAGAEAASGLGRAFFYAGARALLVSNWPVETTSAKELTTELFRLQNNDSGLSRAQALRKTMLSLMDGPGYVDAKSGKTVFSYAHPIFWAPFSLIGDGG